MNLVVCRNSNVSKVSKATIMSIFALAHLSPRKPSGHHQSNRPKTCPQSRCPMSLTRLLAVTSTLRQISHQTTHLLDERGSVIQSRSAVDDPIPNAAASLSPSASPSTEQNRTDQTVVTSNLRTHTRLPATSTTAGSAVLTFVSF